VKSPVSETSYRVGRILYAWNLLDDLLVRDRSRFRPKGASDRRPFHRIRLGSKSSTDHYRFPVTEEGRARGMKHRITLTDRDLEVLRKLLRRAIESYSRKREAPAIIEYLHHLWRKFNLEGPRIR